MPTPFSFLVLLALLPGLRLAAQEPAPLRARLRGEVRDAGGQPWAGAPVILQSVLHSEPTQDEIDRLEVRADEHGRFETHILAGRVYAAWTLGPEQDGRCRASAVVMVREGDRLQLEELPSPARRLRLRVTDPSGCVRLEELRCRLAMPLPHATWQNLQLDAQGETELAPMPGAEALLQILAGDGTSVLHRSLPLNGKAASSKRGDTSPDKEAESALFEIALPELVSLLVKVTAGDKPVVGAEILEFLGGGLQPVGITGDDGIAVVRRGAGSGNGLAAFYPWVRAEGFSDLRTTCMYRLTAKGQPASEDFPGALDIERGRDPDTLRAAGKADLVLAMEPAACIRGRIMLGPDEPAARVALLGHGPYRETRGPAGISTDWSVPYPPRLLRTDEAGAFEIHGIAPGDRFQIHALLPPRATARLRPQARLHPECWVAVGVAGQGEELDLGTIDLSRHHLLEVQVILEDGAPAPHVTLVVAGEDPRLQNQVVCDRLGRTELLLPKLDALTLVATGADRFAKTSTAVPAPSGPVLVRMDPPVFLTGRVLDQDGVAVADAEVRVLLLRRGNDPFHSFLPHPLTKSDAEGRFRLPVHESSSEVRVWARATVQEKTVQSQFVHVQLRRGEHPEVELTLPASLGTTTAGAGK